MLRINYFLIFSFVATFPFLVNCQTAVDNENGLLLNKYDPDSIAQNEKFLQLIIKYVSLTSSRLHYLRQKFFEDQLRNLKETERLYELSYLEPRMIEAFITDKEKQNLITTTPAPATAPNSPYSIPAPLLEA
ncbi:uncharacterized protein LOC122501601 [Leptopilina heterotoma]|uniref:uncharacterized protein LOC122501601 n=1 Tax=Leptopilina heterotoma TaxID=63436 RepID=UPI001CA92670|nr:uncharacterized protein LOC122501601 [Leptopilina heterotoma]